MCTQAACRCLAPAHVAAWPRNAAAPLPTEPRPGLSGARPPPPSPPPAWTVGLGLGPAVAPLATWLCCALAARLGDAAAEAALAAAELAAAPAGTGRCCPADGRFMCHGHFARQLPRSVPGTGFSLPCSALGELDFSLIDQQQARTSTCAAGAKRLGECIRKKSERSACLSLSAVNFLCQRALSTATHMLPGAHARTQACQWRGRPPRASSLPGCVTMRQARPSRRTWPACQGQGLGPSARRQ